MNYNLFNNQTFKYINIVLFKTNNKYNVKLLR